jgi:hypothetical protein
VKAAPVARTVTLDGFPPVLLLDDYCAVMRQGERTVRRQIAEGRCRVAPVMRGPYRWARVDLEAYLSQATVTADRRAHRQARQEAAR